MEQLITFPVNAQGAITMLLNAIPIMGNYSKIQLIFHIKLYLSNKLTTAFLSLNINTSNIERSEIKGSLSCL